jgi:hypothetical protein
MGNVRRRKQALRYALTLILPTAILLSVSLILSQLSTPSRRELFATPIPSYLPSSQEKELQSRQEDNDWFDREKYDKSRKKCFYVEDMCHSSNRWFYRTDETKHQPNFSLQMFVSQEHHPNRDKMKLALITIVFLQAERTPKRKYGYQRDYTPTRMMANETERLGCSESPTPNHVILQSWYNDMLGEFYDRALVGLFELVEGQRVDVDDFVAHSKLYIHRMDPFKSLLDSHQLFTDAFRSSSLGDFLELFHGTQCRCMRRVLFCGYSSKRDQLDNTLTRLVPAGTVFSHPKVRTPVYRKIRNFLRERIILRNPFAQTDIRNFRASILRKHQLFRDSSRPISSWKIVGLAQRSGRRRWLNLNEVLQNLTQPMRKLGIVLVEINVEEDDWTPYRQMVRHAALDGLVGIHGAQLTEAVWMKPRSLVVELLPYIPNVTSYGSWTARTESPTPLGVIFGETDLLHVGYKLGRESAPYCYNETKECWGFKVNPWDARNFIVSPERISNILGLFVVDRPETCEGYMNISLTEKDVVVYNAPCSLTGRPHLVAPRHFYWNETTKAVQ